MGTSVRKMCHTQEIAFERAEDEWRAVDAWSEDVNPASRCGFCCRPTESQVDEVHVVHHEAFQRVDFLLHHDDLTACDAPAMPQCVTAVRRAKVLKRLQNERQCLETTVSEATPRAPPCGDENDPSNDPSEDEALDPLLRLES